MVTATILDFERYILRARFLKTAKGMNTKLALIYSYYMYLEFVRGIFPNICSFVLNGRQNNVKANFWENLYKIDSFPWLPYFFPKIALTKYGYICN